MFEDGQPEDNFLLPTSLFKRTTNKKAGSGRSWGTGEEIYCGVLNCTTCTLSSPDLWFYKLPSSVERQEVWLKAIGRSNIQPHHRLLVCEKHIAPSHINTTTKSSKRYLKRGAIPTLLLPAPNYGDPVTTNATEERHRNQRNNPEKVYTRTRPSTKGNEELSTQNEMESNDRDSVDNSYLHKELSYITMIGTGSKTMDGFINLFIKVKDRSNCDRQIYSDKYKSKILQLYHKNIQMYEFLQSTLCLPPVSILPSFIPSTIVDKNKVFINSLKGKISLKPLNLKYGILCLSIMQIQPHIYYDYELDAFSGVCDVTPIQYAVVAMVRGITDDWYHIASIFFTAALDIFTEFNMWLEILIMTLNEIGINIKAVVTSTDNFFIHAFSLIQAYMMKKNIYRIFDPLHLILLLCDELKNYTVTYAYDEPHQIKKIIAKWEHISKFYEHDSTRKLRLTHGSCTINPDDWQQNKLKSAAQIFSLSTATGISTFVDLGIMDIEAMDTVDFIVRMNSIVSALYPNAFQQEDKNPLAQASGDFWDKNIDFLRNINCTKDEVKVKSKVKFVNCFFRSMTSITLLQEASSLNSFASVLTCNLNQNPLMDFIHKINLKSFTHKYPTVFELLEVINNSIMQNDFHNMQGGVNSMEDFIENANQVFDSLSTVESQTFKQSRRSCLENNFTEMDHDDAGTTFFVATYLLDKMCKTYKNAVPSRMISMSSSVHYENREAGISGSLIVPDNDFLKFVDDMDLVFVNFCKKAMATGRFYVEMMSEMNKLVTGPIHGNPRDYIKSLFIDLRIYQTIKYNNDVYDKDDGSSLEFVVNRLRTY